MNLLRLFLFIAITSLLGCNNPDKGRYKISPPPSSNEKSVYDASIQALSDAIRSSPSISQNYFKRASIYFDNRDFESSLKDINKAIELQPNNPNYLLLKAKNLKEFGKYNEAYPLIKQIESFNLTSYDFYLISAEVYIYKKENQLAKSYLQKAIRNAPQSAEPNFVTGLYLKSIVGDTISAINSFYKTLERDSLHRKAFKEVIDYLKKKKLVDSAIAINDKAIIQFPKESYWRNEKGEILSSVGLYEMAWQAYNQQFKVDSTNVEALINMGNMRIKQKAYSSALSHYTKAQSFSKNSANLYYLTGFCNENLKNYTQAQQSYIKSLKINPDLKLAQDGLNRTTDIINSALGLNY